MNVSLISITKPLINHMDDEKGYLKEISAEDLIVYCARVSNPNNQTNFETSEKLIQYLIKHKHWSPFEMVDMTVDIITSRAIAAQILRHRSFSFQEFSQRYSLVQELQRLEWRKQGKTNRQVGDEEVNIDDILPDIEKHQNNSMQLYKKLIEKGIAKECARMILPLNTSTRIYMKGSLRSWIHYFDVRCNEHCQKEHRDIAIAIREIFKQQFPMISRALNYV